jgi:hypothetical protein
VTSRLSQQTLQRTSPARASYASRAGDQ